MTGVAVAVNNPSTVALVGPLVYPVILLIAVASVGVVRYTIPRLRREFPTDVCVVWYFFSLALVISILGHEWAVRHGAINTFGQPLDEIGQALKKVMEVYLDFYTDVAIIAGLVILFIVPQWLGYFLSGLFGCATKPSFFGAGMTFLFWGIAKFFAVGGGIMASLALTPSLRPPPGIEIAVYSGVLALSLMYVALAFGVLYVFRDMQQVAALNRPVF